MITSRDNTPERIAGRTAPDEARRLAPRPLETPNESGTLARAAALSKRGATPSVADETQSAIAGGLKKAYRNIAGNT